MSEQIKNKSFAGIALIAAIILMFWGTYLPPTGIIDSSVLYGTGQLLLFAATMAGNDRTARKIINAVNELKEIRGNGNTQGNKK